MLHVKINSTFVLIVTSLILIGAGCQEVASLQPSTTPVVAVRQCVLPLEWAELPSIFKDCQLKEVENGSGYTQQLNPQGANGLFDYCNTLIFRRYSTLKGNLYTYEKTRYTHFPVSETGEYRISEDLYEDITNSRPCIGVVDRFGGLGDDGLSSLLFPSRNYRLNQELPGINVLPDVAEKITVPTTTSTSPRPAPKNYCCKTCSKGKACGNSCISRSYTCHQPPGCACDG